jgi:heptosyltransferase-2
MPLNSLWSSRTYGASEAEVRKVMAVRLGRLGDVLLLLPALAALKKRLPRTSIVLVTDHRYADIARLCPYVDEIIPVNRLAMRDGPKLNAVAAMLRLVMSLRSMKFDLALDFHGFCETQLLVWLSGSRFRCGLKRHAKLFLPFCFNQPAISEDKTIHVSEMFHRIVVAAADAKDCGHSRKLLVPPPPITAKMSERLPRGPLVAFYVGARAGDHVWPAARFASLADLVVEQLAASVVVLGGNSQAELSVPTQIRTLCRHPEKVVVLENLQIGEVVAVVSSCATLVSNDSGPMHIGPAVGVPTLGLFSLSSPQHYSPTGPGDKVLWAQDLTSIPIEVVFSSVRQTWGSSTPG